MKNEIHPAVILAIGVTLFVIFAVWTSGSGSTLGGDRQFTETPVWQSALKVALGPGSLILIVVGIVSWVRRTK